MFRSSTTSLSRRALALGALLGFTASTSGFAASFRLSDRGKVIPEQCEREVGGGTGAGGGSGRGPVTRDADDPPNGSVLVVTTLTPALAPLLSRLHGIVAETGSVLSHLAILAREAGVPTVVGYVNATQVLSEGTDVLVDGETGRVTVVSEEVPT